MKDDLFRKLWVETDIRSGLKGGVGKFSPMTIIAPDDNSRLLSYYLFIVPVLRDPRFEIELFVPSDVETHQYYERNSS